MQVTKSKINGYILAGGKSSRMGTDKGLMHFHGKPMIVHVIEQLKPAVDKIVIVSNNPEYEKFGFEVVTDLIKNIGPAGGIFTALSHTDTEKNVMVSCDMPFIKTEAVRFLIEFAEEHEIVLPVFKNNPEPLFGMYSKSCQTKWKEWIDKGIYKLTDLASHFSLLLVDVDGNEFFREDSFKNFNSLSDFDEHI